MSIQGGLRGVIWTDVFQTIIMMTGLLIVAVMVKKDVWIEVVFSFMYKSLTFES